MKLTKTADETARHKLRVLFVDDEDAIRNIMSIELPRLGFDVTLCADGAEAIEALNKQSFDAAIIDLRMPNVDGWGVVDHINEVAPETEFVISTGHGDMDEAIHAVRKGAFDFLPKPTKLFEIANVLNQIGEKLALQNKAAALESQIRKVEGPKSDLIGDGPLMAKVKMLIQKIAPTDSTVLILGETGSGKEMVARRIHELSKRADKPFVAVNCGALPENLVESEFFGHRKGAFTGAETARKGLFEVANGGTLFLDELGELDKTMQVKLLRFLESGEIRRVGENESFTVDVRILCATNRDLTEMAAEGEFRDDLIFRINTFEMHLPALRDRQEDIPELARHLIARHLKKSDISDEFISPEAMDILTRHDWSGNVRELANGLEHAVILSDGHTIKPEDLPANILRSARANGAASVPFQVLGDTKTLREIERDVILQTLNRNGGDKPSTAKELGIALKTLYNKLNQYDATQAA
ncbi:sigma-54-dependent transcriptional regulator [Stratiformator vulcanicus]|uniref:sigma-54-dependent transcriptional regulator n=1 Tax=Stratiformator vulcanicus TaxID=2527980 RepID=UPI0040488C19